MQTQDAVAMFAALAQPTRLEVFRLLVQAGPEGVPAGTVAERLGVVSSTLSHHLGLLERAGLARTRRDGRFVYYAADPDGSRRFLELATGICSAQAESGQTEGAQKEGAQKEGGQTGGTHTGTATLAAAGTG